jgi:hypothetical protein
MSPESVSTIDRVVSVDHERWHRICRRRRALHVVVIGLLWLLVVGAVLDGLDLVDTIGPDERTVRAAGGGFALEVEHPSVTRPALASVFRVRVQRDGGFEEPVQIAVSRRYLESWDLNGVMPSPSGETSLGEWIVWEFDPPPGDELLVTYESRIEPGEQSRTRGEVAVLVDDEPVVRVDLDTKVRP